VLSPSPVDLTWRATNLKKHIQEASLIRMASLKIEANYYIMSKLDIY
jgi:hypothetical protein